MNQIHKVTIPTIFLCGQKDWNVPVLNSELMYQSLKRLGVETQLVVYPNSHHGGWKKQFSRDYYNRALAWMDKYVKKEPAITEMVNRSEIRQILSILYKCMQARESTQICGFYNIF